MKDETNIKDAEGTYRDSVATISKDGKRNFIYPKKPKGKLYNRRTAFSIFYLILFFTLPFIKVNEEPLFMFNVLERKFILFGMVFWPQDFFIFGIGMITFVVFVIAFTVVFGRIFCGWACPQTIFMEMIFRKVEYWIDGDAQQQKQLRAMPWQGKKITKRVLKFIVFFLLSFLIANFFLAYIISMDKLIGYITHPAESAGTLIALLGFTTVFFFVYWWFREQACIVVCPYGRLQGVLLDKNSIVVAYDHKRGEPRGKTAKHKQEAVPAPVAVKEEDCKCVDCKGDGKCRDIQKHVEAAELKTQGDCIDCFACVRVCPTGIDIRNGTQLECVNCTACIDACDAIMTGINKPTGLIRYASHNSIQQGEKLRMTNRVKAYSAVLLLLISLLAFLLMSRTDLDVRLMRTPGLSYTKLPDGRYSNLYNLKLVNKTHKDIPFTLKLENLKGEMEYIGVDSMVMPKENYKTIQFFLKLDSADVKGWKTIIHLGLYANGEKIKTIDGKFIGPEVYE